MDAYLDRDELDAAIEGYLACLGWLVSESLIPDDHHCGWAGDERRVPPCRESSPCSVDYRGGPFTEEAREAARTILANFLDVAGLEDATTYVQTRSASDLGHDLYLSSHGHGAGFFDRGMGELGNRLQEAARAASEVQSWVTADGVVTAEY